jgi:hypothetical protein
MAKSLRELAANPESKALDHMEWLGILLEHETTLRQQKRFEARARTAKLRHLASVEDIDHRAARGLDRALFLKLAGCDWIREHRHCLDYDVDISGGTQAAHYTGEYLEAAGIMFPTKHTIFPRQPDNTPNRDLLVVSIGMSNFGLK